MVIEIIKAENDMYRVRFRHKGDWKYASKERDMKSYIRCFSCKCYEPKTIFHKIIAFDSSCISLCNKTQLWNMYENEDLFTLEEATTKKQEIEDYYRQSLEIGTVILSSKI